jgi:hypothetical protein
MFLHGDPENKALCLKVNQTIIAATGQRAKSQADKCRTAARFGAERREKIRFSD